MHRNRTVTLSDFIENEIELILSDWEAFARTRLPAAEGLSSLALRDEAKGVLLAVASDMRSKQSNAEQAAKSQGLLLENAPQLTATAREHARDRLNQGFTLDQLVSEFRALRASVMRHWSERVSGIGHEKFDELIRFNEALDQALTESVMQYEARLAETRGLLLGALGHDLRNPLGAARTSAVYLLRSEGLNGIQTKAVTRILNSTTRMQQLVADLLDFTRTWLGEGLPVSPRPADLGRVCRHVVDELSAFHPDRVLHFEASGKLDGQWDTARIEQLLSNLGANAVQYSDPDRPVLFTVSSDDMEALVQVHNYGPTIAPHAKRKLFEPLWHAGVWNDEPRTGSSGLGLGLYIAHQIALAHGGSIEVDSTDSDGTTFTVRLPRIAQSGSGGAPERLERAN